jgi:hypothetical protein
MAEMVGLSRGLRRSNGVVGSIVAAVKLGLNRFTAGGRSTRLRPEAWSDYLLRDIGLDGRVRDRDDPRGAPRDWLMR